MYQSKMVRSALRYKKTNTNKFVPLIKIDNDKLYTEKQGLEVLKKITSGSLLIVGFEESETQIPFKMFECYQLNNPRNQSGIWISENFIEDDQYGYKLLCLVGSGNTSQDSMRVHMLCSIIASVVVINVYPGYSGYKFLKALQGRVSYSKLQKQNNQLARQLSNLIILQRGPIRDVTLLNDQSRIKNIQKQQNINDLGRSYRSVNFFQFPQDQQLKYNKKALDDLYLKIVALHLTSSKQEKKLQYGPVLAEYIPQIVRQYNSKYVINYTECLQKIEIDDGYEAYMQAIETYNQCLRRKFNGNQPIQRPDQDLKQFRQSAIVQYKSRTRDMEYLMELNNTIDDKEKKILRINDSLWHDKNIQVLRKESKSLLRYAENRDDTTFDAKKQTQRVMSVYNLRGGGRTKEEDLNGFLQKLNETLGEDNYDKNIRISKLERQNKRLEDRLKKVQKGGCCAGKKCEIM